MKKQLEIIVYDLDKILENVSLHAESVCSSDATSELIAQCLDLSPQINSEGGGGPEVENPCMSVSISECFNWALCALVTLLR